ERATEIWQKTPGRDYPTVERMRFEMVDSFDRVKNASSFYRCHCTCLKFCKRLFEKISHTLQCQLCSPTGRGCWRHIVESAGGTRQKLRQFVLWCTTQDGVAINIQALLDKQVGERKEEC
ncbi:unnamed protein product, partial [Ectocarpus sp. 4 AP-2014]